MPSYHLIFHGPWKRKWFHIWAIFLAVSIATSTIACTSSIGLGGGVYSVSLVLRCALKKTEEFAK
jgi:hypothetical protein